MQSFQHSAFIAVLGLALSPLVAHASSPPTAYISAPSTTTSDHPRPAAKAAGVAALNVGAPRTVRLIYFLPNDRPFRTAAIPRIKDDIRKAQTFFAEQMQAHGYGNTTFRIETDAQGEPLVHRVDAQHPESHYFSTVGGEEAFQYRHFPELEQTFDFYENVYVVYSDVSNIGGGVTGGRSSKKSGDVNFRMDYDFSHWETLAHELGHAFGLEHDFRDGAYIMSYGGPSQFSNARYGDRISAYAAEFLSVHPYFNDAIPIEDYPPSAAELDKSDNNRPPPRRFPGKESSPPTIKLISPTEISSQSWDTINGIRVIPTSYPAGSKSISVQLKVGDAEGLHQVSFHDYLTLREYRSFDGERSTVVDFDYDGSPTYADPVGVVSSLSEYEYEWPHLLQVRAVDTDGNMSELLFELFEVEAEPAVPHSLAKVSGDSQEGPASTQLDDPLVVSVLDADDAAMAGVVVSFSVTAGGGTLSVTTATTDTNGQARSTLTLGSEPGTNTVKATVEGLEPITFTATAGEPASDSQEAPEPGPLSVTIDDVTSVAERGRMTFTVRLEPTPTAPTTVKYTTASRTAIAGADYEVASGTLDFEAGQSTATFIVLIYRDAQDEPDETFGVRIVHPSTGALLAEATGTITDDDGASPPEGDSDGDELADSEEADGEIAFGFSGAVEDQHYTAGSAISDLVLPEATGGEGEITYRVQGLPAGLSFDTATRTISGTPEAATDGAVEVSYTAEDSAGEVSTLTFSITVNPALSFGDLFDLFGAGGE